MEAGISFADYDHENERFVDLWVSELSLDIERRLEFNEDYAPDAEPPPEWSESLTLEFSTMAALRDFLTLLGAELVQSCFSVFDHRSSQLDSDEAREAVKNWIAQLDDAADKGVATGASAEDVARLCSFPR